MTIAASSGAWAYRLIAPRRFERVEVAAPAAADILDGEVLLRLRAASICGSDLPRFTNPGSVELPGPPGYPLHEVYGEVVASTDEALRPGQRLVGIADGFTGLRQYVINPAQFLREVPNELSDVEAVLIQPLATVLHAVGRLPDVAGRAAAVIGLGPLGLLFAHVLDRLGARHVTGIDPVDRSWLACRFGIDELVTATAADWVTGLVDDRRPDVCVEAVGHQRGTFDHAIRATAPGGHMLAFGVPDDEYYTMSFGTFFHKNLTLHAGVTTDWPDALRRACEWMRQERQLLGQLVTHILPVTDVQDAFRLSCRHEPGRLKVVLLTEYAISGLQ